MDALKYINVFKQMHQPECKKCESFFLSLIASLSETKVEGLSSHYGQKLCSRD